MELEKVDPQQITGYHGVIDNMHSWLAGQLTESTIAMYKRDVEAYQKYASLTGQNALDPQTLMNWRDHLVLTTSMSPNTINRMIAAVKRTIKQAGNKKVIEHSLALAFKEVEGVRVKALKGRLKRNARTRIEPEEMRQLCSLPDSNSLIDTRDRALLATLASSGLRAEEAAHLTMEQIRKQGDGYILQIIGKSDIEPRDAHLSVEAYNHINEWIARRPIPSQYIFTSFEGRGDNRLTSRAMSETSIWKIVKKYAWEGKLLNVKPHDFRRFVGTQLAARDIRKAQLALGHKSIETTARHYVLDKITPGETDNLY